MLAGVRLALAAASLFAKKADQCLAGFSHFVSVTNRSLSRHFLFGVDLCPYLPQLDVTGSRSDSFFEVVPRSLT